MTDAVGVAIIGALQAGMVCYMELRFKSARTCGGKDCQKIIRAVLNHKVIILPREK